MNENCISKQAWLSCDNYKQIISSVRPELLNHLTYQGEIVREILDTYRIIADLPSESLGALGDIGAGCAHGAGGSCEPDSVIHKGDRV